MTTYLEVIGIGSCGPIYRVQENEEIYVLKYSAAPSPLDGIPHHPNVIQFHHQSKTEQGWKILYKDCLGIDLEQIIRRTKLPHCTDIILQLCRGLKHLHAQGIIHRDLKPSNVVLSTNGDVFIIDCERSKEKNIHVSRIIGHEPYLAPETKQNGEYSPASDIYALGMILKSLLKSQGTNIQKYKEVITMCTMDIPEKRPSLSQIIRLLPSQTESIRSWARINIPKLCAQRKEYFSSHILPKNTTGVQKTSASLWLGLICLLCGTIYTLQEEDVQYHKPPVIKTIPAQTQAPTKRLESSQIKDSVPKEAPKIQVRSEGTSTISKKSRKDTIQPEREYRISSIPWGAKVWIDNQYIGKTIITKISLTQGAHTVIVEYNETKMRYTLHFDDTHTGYVINIEQNHWKKLSGQ